MRPQAIEKWHALAEARDASGLGDLLADDVVFVSRGRIDTHQPAAEFFAKPRSRTARAYLEGRLDLDALDYL